MAQRSSLPNSGRKARWDTLGLGPLARDLVLLALPRFLLIFRFPLVMGLIGLTMIFSSAVFADKKHVTPRLNLVNVAGLTKVVRSEIFVSEDRQLRAVHLILNFEPLSNQFQDVGQVIRAGDLRLRQIDVFVPSFLARENLPSVELPLHCAFPEEATPRKETASSCLSLKAKIDQFHLEEKGEVQEEPVEISNSEDELDRASAARSPKLIVAHVDPSS